MSTPLPRRSCALPECARSFLPPHHLSRYCSPECAKSAMTAQLKALGERRKAGNAPKRSPRPCDVCGETFTPVSSRQRFCSKPLCKGIGYTRPAPQSS